MEPNECFTEFMVLRTDHITTRVVQIPEEMTQTLMKALLNMWVWEPKRLKMWPFDPQATPSTLADDVKEKKKKKNPVPVLLRNINHPSDTPSNTPLSQNLVYINFAERKPVPPIH